MHKNMMDVRNLIAILLFLMELGSKSKVEEKTTK